MSEFIVDTPQFLPTTTKVLVNTGSSPVFLQLRPTPVANTETFLNLRANQTVFYNDVVVENKLLPTYNKEFIGKYLSQGILQESIATIQNAVLEIRGVTGTTAHIKYENGKFIKRSPRSSGDHFQVYPLMSPSNELLAVVYRDLDGISYTVDNNIIVKVPNTGLQFPSEITSVAIQASTSYDPSTGAIKIWAGTLREGVKSFTIGESSWKSEGSNEFITLKKTLNYNNTGRTFYEIRYLFRRSLINTNNSVGLTTPIYSHIPGDFEPTYVLSVHNYPKDAGNPVHIYTRTTYQELAAPNTLNRNYSVLIKYLYPTVYSYDISSSRTKETTLVPHSYPVLLNLDPSGIEIQAESQLNGWRVSNELTSQITDPIVDIVDRYQINSSESPLSTTSGEYVVVSTYKDSVYKIQLLSLTATAKVLPGLQRGSAIYYETAIGSSINIAPEKYSGISTFRDDFNSFIFLTAGDKIYKKSGLTWTTSPIVNAVSNLKLSPTGQFSSSGTSYLEGLKGFGLFPTADRYKYLAIMFTDFGLVSMTATTTSQEDLILAFDSATFRRDLAVANVASAKTYQSGNIFTANLKSALPVIYKFPETFDRSTRCYFISKAVIQDNASYSTQSTVKYYKNYSLALADPGIYHNIYNSLISVPNIDQYYSGNTLTENIFLRKSFSTPVAYRSGKSFDFVTITSPTASVDTIQQSWILRDSLLSNIKYQDFRLRLRYTESLTDSFGTEVVTDYDFSILPDLEFQVRTTDPAYVLPGHISTGYGN